MKHIFLIASLMLSTAHASLAMELEVKLESPSKAIQLCLVGINEANVDKVKQGLSLGADVNYTNNKKESLFYLASETGNKEIINVIISHNKIDLYSRDNIEGTPLHAACNLGLTTTVESILLRDAQTAHICDQEGATPLHMAAAYGENNCVELLIPHSNVNQQSYDGNTALHDASYCGKLDVCKLLVEKGSRINQQNYDGNTPLHITENVDIIQFLLNNGGDSTIQNNNRETPLYILFNNNAPNFINNFQEDIIKKAVLATDKYKNTQLHLCITTYQDISFLYKDYISFLISYGINTIAKNDDGQTAMKLACQAAEELDTLYHIEQLPYIKKILLSQINTTNDFLLAMSEHIKDENLCSQYASRISTIMQNNSEETANDTNPTPLMSAIDDILQLLVQNIDYQDQDGNTALHYACQLQEDDDMDVAYEIIQPLLKKGAITTIKNKDQETPISRSYSPHGMRIFLEKYPDLVTQLILTTDEQQNNQFHLCAQHYPIFSQHSNEFAEYLSFLQSHGLNIHAKNNNQETALNLARNAYKKLYNYYIASQKFSLIKDDLDEQEHLMHTFLRCIPLPVSTVLLALQEITDEKNGHHVIKDLKSYIAWLYYAINLETIVAKKYKNSSTYYSDYIENKNRIRQQLLYKKSEPCLLWKDAL